LDGIRIILEEEVVSAFSPLVAEEVQASLSGKLFKIVEQTFDRTTVMDSEDQMREIAASTMPTILDFLGGVEFLDDTPGLSLVTLSDFRSRVTTKATALHEKLRREYLYGSRGPTPAIAKLGKTRGIYSYIRKDLAVKMHGTENFSLFPNAIGVDEVSAGENISKIYEVSKQRPQFQPPSGFLMNMISPYATGRCRMLYFRCLFDLASWRNGVKMDVIVPLCSNHTCIQQYICLLQSFTAS